MDDFNMDEFDCTMMPGSAMGSDEKADLSLPINDKDTAVPPELPGVKHLAPARPPRGEEVDLISPRTGSVSPRPAPPPKPASPRREKSPSKSPKSARRSPKSPRKEKVKAQSAPTSPTCSRIASDEESERSEKDEKAEKPEKEGKKEPPSPRKKRGLFRGLSTHNVSDSALSRSKNKKRGKTTTDLHSLVASDSLIEVVLKSDWEHVNDKTELGQKLQKELVKLSSEKAVIKETTENLKEQNVRLRKWKSVLEDSAKDDQRTAEELEQKIAEMKREIRTYERLCRDLESQTKSVKASVQQGVNFLKPYTTDMLTAPAAPTSPRGHVSPRSPR